MMEYLAIGNLFLVAVIIIILWDPFKWFSSHKEESNDLKKVEISSAKLRYLLKQITVALDTETLDSIRTALQRDFNKKYSEENYKNSDFSRYLAELNYVIKVLTVRYNQLDNIEKIVNK